MAIKIAGIDDIKKLINLIKNRFGNVENKSGETIRSEMTNQEVVNALGYTPEEYREVRKASLEIDSEKDVLVVVYKE